jgi:hypothetical protein
MSAAVLRLVFSLVATSWLHWVLTQPLESTQHNALMNVYDGLGSFVLNDLAARGRLTFFYFFLL